MQYLCKFYFRATRGEPEDDEIPYFQAVDNIIMKELAKAKSEPYIANLSKSIKTSTKKGLSKFIKLNF